MLLVLVVAVIGSIAAWAVFFKAWTTTGMAPAPRFALPASTGRRIALQDFFGRQPLVLVFYMVAT